MSRNIFLPAPEARILCRDIQPLLPRRALVWCGALGVGLVLFHVSRFYLVATTPAASETGQALWLYGVNHGSI